MALRLSDLDLPATFVLVHDPTMPNEDITPPDDFDGPFLSADGHVFIEDDQLTFWVDGALPYHLLVDRQDGNELVLKSGDRLRVEPWPLKW